MESLIPTVVNKYKVNMDDPDIVYIGRGSMWGNEYTHIHTGTKATYRVDTVEQAIEAFRIDLWKRLKSGEVTVHDLLKLSGKRLACFCKPKPCHGDVLVKAVEWALTKQSQTG